MKRKFVIFLGLIAVELLACKHQRTTSASLESLEQDDRDCGSVPLESHPQNWTKLGEEDPNARSDADYSSKISSDELSTSNSAENEGLGLIAPQPKNCPFFNRPSNVLQVFVATRDVEKIQIPTLNEQRNPDGESTEIRNISKDTVFIPPPHVKFVKNHANLAEAALNIFAYDAERKTYEPPCTRKSQAVPRYQSLCRDALYEALTGVYVDVGNNGKISNRPLVSVVLSRHLTGFTPIYYGTFINSGSTGDKRNFCTFRLIERGRSLVIDTKQPNRCEGKYRPAPSFFPLPNPLQQDNLPFINSFTFAEDVRPQF